jgi:4-amino-4-deoxy-L-arabinose transferase-like glycosyltransferase
MATGASTIGSFARAYARRRVGVPRLTAEAWGSITIVAAFLGITCWWLSQDDSIPVFDAGLHLTGAFYAFDALRAGNLGHAFTLTVPYPPLAYLVGALGIAIGGLAVAPPIVAENLVFVPLLALGCYHVSRIVFNRTAGLLAVAFALSSPLITAQFHVFMIDAPETAMVAVSLWAILATEDFSRLPASAVAGMAVGLGLLSKEPSVFYVVGPTVVALARGRVRALRGFLLFASLAALIALPWYLNELSHVKSLGSAAVSEGAKPSYAGDIAPAPLSLDNLEWYFWNLINAQLYLPLFVFSASGFVWAASKLIKRRIASPHLLDLLVGAVIAWFAITETFVHDTRYSMPLLVYLAVFGVGWITYLSRQWRRTAIAVLVLACVADVAGTSFGLGRSLTVNLGNAHTTALQQPGRFTIFSNHGYQVSKPKRDGDMLATLEALQRNGVRAVVVEASAELEVDFSGAGLVALDLIASLPTVSNTAVPVSRIGERYAFLHHGSLNSRRAPPCVRLADDSGVWINLGDDGPPERRYYCPSRDLEFYPE